MLQLSRDVLEQIWADGEAHYPGESAGLLLGSVRGEVRFVTALHALANRAQDGTRRTWYRLEPLDLMDAEDEAERQGLQVLGVFHSHPDHPAKPRNSIGSGRCPGIRI
ncbi:MAG: M67 family metallopeptidase [Chloroflexota bacterium]